MRSTAPVAVAAPLLFAAGRAVPKCTNKKVQILNRETLGVVGFFGGHGGHGAAEFYHIHSVASDSKSNIHLGESFGQRALKWAYKGGLR